MNNKKILMSFLLVVLIAISVSAVSAEDAADVLAVDDDADVVAVDEAVDVVAVDEAADVVADTIEPNSTSVADVQSAVSSAKTGDTVDLSKNPVYNFTNNTVTISTDGIIIDGKGTTTIYGWGDGNGIFAINKAKNVTIQGITFIDDNPKNDLRYNGTVAGWGISATAANGGVVKDCEFTDFNSGIVVMQTSGFTIQENHFKGGYSTKLANDPTVNKEQGTKAVNIYKQSDNVAVLNNSFIGPILDGVSIAQGSGSNKVLNNFFAGNCYSIYFGGASTAGSIVKGNFFENCGFFKEGNISWEGLPIISIQKSSDNITIDDNDFAAINNNILIAAEKGNEAHGFPTQIGNINVTHNTVYKLDSNDKNIILFHILVRESNSLEITSPINVTGNDLDPDVKGVSINFDGKEIFSASNVYLNSTLDANKVFSNETLFGTTLTVKDLSVYAGNTGKLSFTLKDSNDVPLANKQITVVIDGSSKIVKTGDNGVATLSLKYSSASTKYVTAVYLGEGNLYKSAIDTAKITVKKKATTLTSSKTKVSAKVKKAIKITVTLKNGKTAIKGKKVTIKVNGKTYKGTTKSNGKVTITIKVTKKGTYKAAFKFAGDSAYKASSSKTVKFTIKK